MVLKVDSVRKSFRNSDGIVPVLQDVSFELEAGQHWHYAVNQAVAKVHFFILLAR